MIYIYIYILIQVGAFFYLRALGDASLVSVVLPALVILLHIVYACYDSGA